MTLGIEWSHRARCVTLSNMSASNEWTEYHLTPKGWVEGSCQVDFAGVQHKEPPPDRVITERYREELSSSFSKVHRTTTVQWMSGDTATIARLKGQFGQCPQSL